MHEFQRNFIKHLQTLFEKDRGARATLRRSLSFELGEYFDAYPYVERFVSQDWHASDAKRKALYLTAGLFAVHPVHHEERSFAEAFGILAKKSQSNSLETRFIALLSTDSEGLAHHLRHAVRLLENGALGFDYIALLNDVMRLLNPWESERSASIKQNWARAFYRAYDSQDNQSGNSIAESNS